MDQNPRKNRWKLHADADFGRFPVKPINCLGGKIHPENHYCRGWLMLCTVLT